MAMNFLEPYEPRRYSAPDLGVAYLDDGDLREVDDEDTDDDERFHVEVSFDDVKLMTLEQLDDAYRLDIIDENTRVWKPGMADWLPLKIVAGMDDSDTPVVHVDPPAAARPSSHAPSPVRSSPPPPPAAARSSVPAAPTLRPTVAPVTRRPALVVEPIEAWPAPVSVPPPVSQPAQMLPPAPVASVAPFAAPLAQPFSVAPVARSMPPASMQPARSSRLGTFTLGLAVAAGLLVTLYRNDVLLDLAKTWHYETAFLSVEKSLLGGPTPGTTRALEGLVATAPASQPEASSVLAGSAAAPDVATKAATEESKQEPQDEPASKAAIAPEQLAPADPEPAEATAKTEAAPAEATPSKAAPPVRAKPAARATRAAAKPAPASRSLAASVQAQTPKAKAAPPAEDAAPKAPKKVTKSALDRAIAEAVTRPKSKAKPQAPKAKGSEFDPMNGSL